jgi:opacity protein-like surface antigen
MKTLIGTLLFVAALASAQDNEHSPRHEIGLTLGRVTPTDRNMLRLGAGTALQANYGHRIWQGDTAAVYAEVHFLGNPQRLVTAPNQTLTRDVATIFLTPGVRVKFRPLDTVSPYVVGGGGYAVFEQSLNRLDGQPNGAPRTIGRGSFMFGGGVDVKLWQFIAVRAEARDFYSGSPAYNTSALAGGQHNVTIGGGVVLRFR